MQNPKSVARKGQPALRLAARDLPASGQDRLERLLSSSPSVIYSYRATGDFAPTFVSANITDVLGYEPREYLEDAEFWRRSVHPDELAAVEAEAVHLFRKGRHSVEYRFRRKDGSWCWVRDEQRLVRDRTASPRRSSAPGATSPSASWPSRRRLPRASASNGCSRPRRP